MDNEEYATISELEQAGKIKEGFALLTRLVDEKHPLALLDMSLRCYSTEGFVYPIQAIATDANKSEELLYKQRRNWRNYPPLEMVKPNEC